MKRFEIFKIKDDPYSSGEGKRLLYRFPNGYGASVIKFVLPGSTVGSYGAADGQWELAVIKFEKAIPLLDYTLGVGLDSKDFGIAYDTPVTDDVMGHLTDEDVGVVLKQIKELKDEDVREDKEVEN